jgi:hypothetical protein
MQITQAGKGRKAAEPTWVILDKKPPGYLFLTGLSRVNYLSGRGRIKQSALAGS